MEKYQSCLKGSVQGDTDHYDENDLEHLSPITSHNLQWSADDYERTKLRYSGLRPPSKLPTTIAKPLQQVSTEDINVRANGDGDQPSQLPSLKRKPSSNLYHLAKRNALTGPDHEPADFKAPRSTIQRNISHGSKHSQSINSVQQVDTSGPRSFRSGNSRNFKQRNFQDSGHRPVVGTAVFQASASHSGHETIQNQAVNQRAPSDIRNAWDTKGRLEGVDQLYGTLWDQMNFAKQSAANETSSLHEQLNLYKVKVAELETTKAHLESSNGRLQADLNDIRSEARSTKLALEDKTRELGHAVDDLKRSHRIQADDIKDIHERELRQLRRQLEEDAEDQVNKLQKEFKQKENGLREELQNSQSKTSAMKQISDQIETDLRKEVQNIGELKDREVRALKSQLDKTDQLLEQEKRRNAELTEELSQSKLKSAELETSMEQVKAKVTFLESDSQAQSQAFADSHKSMQEALERAADATEKLRKEESIRRKLHNQVQELKGNIRVFCRVRPALQIEACELSNLEYPDAEGEGKELAVMGLEQKTALGKSTAQKHHFVFDRVFSPSSQNSEIFEELSQLVQSALDGYNVCIFCYGQTGSGKTYTMSSSSDGMIPLAVQQIYDAAKALEEKSWTYTMTGSFVEVYNENINDLLGTPEDIDKKKCEIIHEKGHTTIADAHSVSLHSPSAVDDLLARANNNRSVAATKANERSSRSHSVFTIKMIGENPVTGETARGTLNLVDLAGSERLSHSQATGDRLRETQNINRSLSCLGDVISALGQGKEHIPYRNSKLTYLLQNSLGGNSKTLMLVMISPLMCHLGESISSLKFATKVSNTHIGTAKRQIKA